MKNKPSWLYDSLSGMNIHRFLYGYEPTAMCITRAALRIARERFGLRPNAEALIIRPPVMHKIIEKQAA